MITTPLLTVALREEQDVVAARQRTLQLGRLLGFDAQDQVRMATAVSELARNVINYATQGQVSFSLARKSAQTSLHVELVDDGPGIADLSLILSGRYRSTTGLGLGIVGARKLMDGFEIESTPDRGTRVGLLKNLPPGAPSLDGPRLAGVVEELARGLPRQGLVDVRLQNQELLRAIENLRDRQEEVARLNREIEETNRGVLALYAELDEKAEYLRRADQMKSRFLSHMSHEFRTPLNSILAISRLLLERTDGTLTPEQDKQVSFVRKSAQDLTELVNDLLDLAKVEAGKIVVRATDFDARRMVGALRGMMRPLVTSEDVTLILDDPPVDFPLLLSDEAKISQILRNFISNALKFTSSGEIRLRIRTEPGTHEAVFSVSDTGIGIARDDQARVFDEFAQIDSPKQREFKGTGLGLALARKLAELLGGRIELVSEVGRGSTFSLFLPLPVPAAAASSRWDSLEPGDFGRTILIVDDDPASRYAMSRLFDESVVIAEADDGGQALLYLRTHRPAALLLDLVMPGMGGLEVLAALRADPDVHPLPTVVATSKILSDEERIQLGSWGVPVLPKAALSRADAATELKAALQRAGWTAPGISAKGDLRG